MLNFLKTLRKVLLDAFFNVLLGLLVVFLGGTAWQVFYAHQTNTPVEGSYFLLQANRFIPRFNIPGQDVSAMWSDKTLLEGVETCQELINTWRPAHLPDDARVQCVDSIKGQPVTARGLTEAVTVTDKYAKGPSAIYLRNDTPIEKQIEVYNHEAYHALSFSWSEEKQNAFLDSLGAQGWSERGLPYLEQPMERFAWAATSCYAEHENYRGYSDLLPGGCDTVGYWLADS